ncbi:phage tail protein [Conexibacter arvalis]|uniref:Microcystin-dependent protein n=1 Tax=Conexibacter arvalis TaxID=912552 RepID=A0A840IFL1_9ACTN|nr:tail fiber protein [Conexibacter arvalis]MBB4662973.1 microcystin-dependent protein [Conexibacter arvalis]
MSEPYLGEIRAMSFGFAPRGWAQCNGQLLPINQNQALFSILGATYGGDGRTNFALPDLRGRVPMGTDFAGHPLGERAGVEAVTLTPQQIPSHSHEFRTTRSPGNDVMPATLASAPNLYGAPTRLTPIGGQRPAGQSIASAGAQPHANMMPFAVVGFCIALQGIFPSRD